MGYNREIERSQYNVRQCSFHGTKEDTCVTVDVTPKVWNLFFHGNCGNDTVQKPYAARRKRERAEA